MARITFLILLILPGFQACQNEEAIPDPIENWRFPVVVYDLNTRGFTPVVYTGNHSRVAGYFPLYFGYLKDTLIADHFINPFPPPPKKLFALDDDMGPGVPMDNDSTEGPDLLSPYFEHIIGNEVLPTDSAQFTLYIDTLATIPVWNRTSRGNLNIEEALFLKAHPLLIVNHSSETAIVGYGRHLDVIMEARDKDGNWKPIEHRHTTMCGTGIPIILLPPGECVLTAAPLISGSILTKLRVRIGNSYSAEFTGSIEPGQFERDWSSLD